MDTPGEGRAGMASPEAVDPTGMAATEDMEEGPAIAATVAVTAGVDTAAEAMAAGATVAGAMAVGVTAVGATAVLGLAWAITPTGAVITATHTRITATHIPITATHIPILTAMAPRTTHTDMGILHMGIIPDRALVSTEAGADSEGKIDSGLKISIVF